MLQQITYLFPNTAASRAFFEAAAHLFTQAPGATAQADRLMLAPTNPPAALPITSLRTVEVEFPQLVFETEQWIDLPIGPLHLRSSMVPNRPSAPASETTAPAQTLLPIEEVYRRLDGHVTRVDHTGLNIPAATLDRAGWERLLQQLSAVSNLYKYPGEDWPFILPATEQEFQTDIHQFVTGREPKFELVYDRWTPHPLFQFALGTDLTRPEVEALFPKPYGVAFPGLGDIFRTVFLAHPWPGLTIRFDLLYRAEGVSDWDTGEWLIKEGGRIR
jgi:hypothetical protein